MVDITALILQNPKLSVILIAVLVTFFVSIINYFFLDKVRMREIRERQKTIQKEMKEHKDNPAKVKELYSEMMSHTMESMRHSFKPMLITFIPIIVVFGFIRNIFAESTLAGSWIWWYLGAAILSSLIFRKLFKLP